jgi:hypothetical protein
MLRNCRMPAGFRSMRAGLRYHAARGGILTKRPNTLKMQRLLQQLVECDPRSAKEVRELQDDSRKLLGLTGERAPAHKAKTASR